MRHPQMLRRDHLVPVEEDIEVQLPRPVSRSRTSARPPLHGFQAREQVMRLQVRPPDATGVEEAGLLEHELGCRLVYRGEHDALEPRPQRSGPHSEVLDPRLLIRTETDRDRTVFPCRGLLPKHLGPAGGIFQAVVFFEGTASFNVA